MNPSDSDASRFRSAPTDRRGERDLDDLLVHVARGDQVAFEAVYDRLVGPVFGVIRRVLRDPAQSEEAALIEVFKKQRPGEPPTVDNALAPVEALARVLDPSLRVSNHDQRMAIVAAALAAPRATIASRPALVRDFVGAYLGVGIMAFALPSGLRVTLLLILPPLIAMGSLCGDLLESSMKREFAVKDAGAWLPGFGGLLDRIDSLIMVGPPAFYLLKILE